MESLQAELTRCDPGVTGRMQADVDALRLELEGVRSQLLRSETTRDQVSDQLHTLRIAALRYPHARPCVREMLYSSEA